jgi:hypothetical protein
MKGRRNMDRDLLASAKSGKMRAGKMDLIKHLEGGKLHRAAAVKAKCYDCDGMGDSGACDIPECSLYPYSPYRARASRQKQAS